MRGLFGHGAGLALAAASLVGLGAQVVPATPAPEPERPRKRSRPVRRYRSSGGVRPHQGEREIARRLRQAARNEERQRARVHARIEQSRGTWTPAPGTVGISRRGRFLTAVSDGR